VVLVCDNLAFFGEIRVFRKHTVFVMRDLPYMVDTAVTRLNGAWADQDRRIAAYRNSRLPIGSDCHRLWALLRRLTKGGVTMPIG
jgi:hypothetical protein